MAVRYATLRASDADRDAVADRLRRAAIEGRLDPDELDERLDKALRAKTYGELDPLVADLPGAPATPRPRPKGPAFTAPLTPPLQRRPPAGLAFAVALRVAFVLAVVCVLAVAVAATIAWWMLIALIWLVAHALRGCSGRRRPAFHRPPIV